MMTVGITNQVRAPFVRNTACCCGCDLKSSTVVYLPNPYADDSVHRVYPQDTIELVEQSFSKDKTAEPQMLLYGTVNSRPYK